ncbi:MAG TPA: hypothetical protein PLM07_00730 [Candidatus Rifleibacterium sp.]|nr:hypothetical protein [Candidatus Rifleibacterium sp.]HPT44405.1 hypothetical protein [Candidatus Rifleibacterium sp.]
MNQQEIRDYLKKNKTVAFGVPFIVCVLLLDVLILKPARLAKKQGATATTATTQTAALPTAAGVPAAATGMAPIAPPDPIATPVYPALSDKIESRFSANQLYPYADNRNVFLPAEKVGAYIVETAVETGEPVLERPDITYHGFFTLGADKVAILRFANELLLTKLGATLKRTNFSLTSVFPDRVVISDSSEGIRDFEVSLSDKPEDK